MKLCDRNTWYKQLCSMKNYVIISDTKLKTFIFPLRCFCPIKLLQLLVLTENNQKLYYFIKEYTNVMLVTKPTQEKRIILSIYAKLQFCCLIGTNEIKIQQRVLRVSYLCTLYSVVVKAHGIKAFLFSLYGLQDQININIIIAIQFQ